ncbi:MFS transporter [Herbidospora sp. NEAU-GS84]|uniref:MFS transporter n=1 Tax=Herbidospora solisilvae TaxID=2696284 RepID=A0A7C9MVV0_9ACTN|nr:MFS transporter [Herbidospora solisilvae]NAS21711.1 MFS transporter [Herbidospora solisilvae]
MTAIPLASHQKVQRRTLGVLSAVQIVSGVGIAVGSALSSLMVYELSGSEAISGLAGTATVTGAALMALPAARAADGGGRRAGLTLAHGVAFLGCVAAAASIQLGSWPLLLLALVMVGTGSAGNLSARYAATDLAPPGRTARHLSLVVWAATIGSVAGPNLAHPADALGVDLGLAPAAGPFALSAVAFALSLLIVNGGLRPDPLLLARQGREVAAARRRQPLREAVATVKATPAARTGLLTIAAGHTAMVSVMSMTPVHLDHGHAGIAVIGMVLSLHIAGMFMFSPLVGWAADRLGRAVVATAGMGVLVAAGLLAAFGGHDVPVITAGLVLLGLGWSCSLVAGSAMLTEAVDLERRPAVQGLSDLTMNVCGAVGALLAGAIVGTLSYPVLGLITAALSGLTGVVIRRRSHLASA